MTEERDPKLSRHYRELEPLEPSAELDRKILDAAHAAAARHAPLVTPAGRHRWYYGLATAAVLVFAVAVTLHMERERPDPEAAAPGAALRLERELRGQIKPAPQPAAPSEPKPAAKPEAPPPVAFAPDPQSPRESGTAREATHDASSAQPSSPTRPAPEPARATASRQARSDAMRLSQKQIGAERAATAATSAGAPAAVPSAVPEKPEAWLERIAELRSRGRHADADRELVAFRRAYPDYRLSDLMRERVEGTPIPSR